MNRIRELRKAKGITAQALADMLGITPKHLYDLEAGKRRLHEDVIRRLAEFFEVSSDYVLGRVPHPGIRLVEGPNANEMIEQIVAALPPDLFKWLSSPEAAAWIEVSREAEESGLEPGDVERVIEFLRQEKVRWEKEGKQEKYE